jgi:hypothetical protein
MSKLLVLKFYPKSMIFINFVEIHKEMLQIMVAYLERFCASCWCVVMWLVDAMSHCRSVQIEGLAYKPNNRATLRQGAAPYRAVWRASLETKQGDSAKRAVSPFVVLSLTTSRKGNNDIGCVVGIDNQISHHNK